MLKSLKVIYLMFSKIVDKWDFFIEDTFGMGNTHNKIVNKTKK
jgi:hypothetical protein